MANIVVEGAFFEDGKVGGGGDGGAEFLGGEVDVALERPAHGVVHACQQGRRVAAAATALLVVVQ